MIWHFRLLFSALICLCATFCCYSQQNVRVFYSFLRKADKADAKFKSGEMTLDLSGTEAVFYNEDTFLADSLDAVSHNSGGEIIDEQAASERRQHNGSRTELVHADYSLGQFDSFYRVGSESFITKNERLDLPEWTLHPDSTRSFNGYQCKMASADYLGRKWTVWYTEQIPLPSGPWLLWGCPGMIVYAIDSDKLFNFYLLGVEYTDEFRWPRIEKYYAHSFDPKHHISYPSLRELESVKTRANRDNDFKLQLLTGTTGVRISVQNRDGTTSDLPKRTPYQPLIAESYWKNR